jgi:hypothetical protein
VNLDPDMHPVIEPQADLFRFWRTNIGKPDGTMRSPNGRYVWRRGLNTATCQLGHRAPDARCTCGFWGTTSQEGTAEYWRSQTSMGDEPLIYVECLGAGVIA